MCSLKDVFNDVELLPKKQNRLSGFLLLVVSFAIDTLEQNVFEDPILPFLVSFQEKCLF